ncbi:MAG: leucine-rich repeat domain-containing protein, partial [Clostridia bacterium]|nr:leucine-rich repeat domain-containing protein [Clostridia bacterium]
EPFIVDEISFSANTKEMFLYAKMIVAEEFRDTHTEEGLTYSASSGIATITGMGMFQGRVLNIPSNIYDNITVNNIHITHGINNNLLIKTKKLILPSSITSIYEESFIVLSKLESIVVDVENITYKSEDNCLIEISSNTIIRGCNSSVIPSSVENIGLYAFSYCSFETITIPDNIVNINGGAFGCCFNLKNIQIPNSIENLGLAAFVRCVGLTSIIFEENSNLITMGESIFYGCGNLTSIAIPNGVTSIGESSFYNCTSLLDIAIPSSVTSIGNSAFRGCTNLTSIAIPSSVTSIDTNAFSGCKFTTVTYSKSGEGFSFVNGALTLSGNGTLSKQWTNWENLILDVDFGTSNYTSIGSYAFSYCYNLTTIEIPSSVTSIGANAFSGCKFTTVTYSKSGEEFNFVDGTLTLSGTGTLSKQWTNWEELILDIDFGTSNYTALGSSAFSYCTSLTTITIPSSVTSIGGSAFDYCRFNTVNFSKSGEGFNFVDGTLTLTGSGTLSKQWANWEQLILKVDFGASNYTIIDSNTFQDCSSLRDIKIPDSVIAIGSFIFGNCPSLICNTIDFVDYLGNENNLYLLAVNATNPNIISANIQETTKFIYNDCFKECYYLESINIPNSIIGVGYDTFLFCDLLKTIYINSATVASSLTPLSACGYLCNHATSVYIKSDISTIGSYILNNFTKNDTATTVDGIEYYLWTKIS